MKRKILILIILVLIIFLSIEFIPGFFSNDKSKQIEKPSDQNIKTKEIPATTTPTLKSENNAKDATSSPTPNSIPQLQNNIKDTTDQYLIKSASLLGLDTAIESPHFIIYYHKTDEDKVKELLTISEKDYLALVKLFPKTPRTEILITYDTNEYINVFNAAPPWSIESYKNSNSGGGVFCPNCINSLGNNTEYIYMLRPTNKSFAHELAHRYFWASYPNLHQNDNLIWLNEGQAVYAQTEVAPGPGGLSSNLEKINNFYLPVNFLELNQLQQQGNNSSLERFYDLAGLMAYYIDAKTNGGLYSFIADLNNTKDLDKTCQNNLGFSSDQLFSKWKNAIIATSASNSIDFLKNYKIFIKK
ncbi:MAG: hypothetical protein WC264_01740 [Candidatus Paceibacterota bacterium]|jgi:hypothetical protein